MVALSNRVRVASLLIAVLPSIGNAWAAGDTPALSVGPAPSGPAGLATADPPALRYGVLYADAEGRSHVQYCDLKNFAFKSYAPPAPPQYVGAPPGDVSSIAYAVLPVGYVGPWHAAPGPQWVITLSGRWSVEATDGTVMEQGPGEIQFNADSGSKPQGPDGRAGHLTRQVGDVPTVQLIVSVKKKPEGDGTEPCQPAP